MEKEILAHLNTDEVRGKIQEILSRGKVVVFTNILTGTKKFVTRWNPDADGDLFADYSTGSTRYVCPYAVEYEISETDIIPNN